MKSHTQSALPESQILSVVSSFPELWLPCMPVETTLNLDQMLWINHCQSIVDAPLAISRNYNFPTSQKPCQGDAAIR